MSQIYIDPERIDALTQNLNVLRSTLLSGAETVPGKSGEGPVAEGTALLGDFLIKLQESLETLMSATISFMENARTSYVNTDEKISAGYHD